MLLPEKHFPRFSVGKGGKSMKRRIACLAVCLLAVLLPLRALAAEETAAVQTRAGDWTPSRSAMPGEELHFRATLTLRTGESWTVRSVFSPGVEFLALTAVRARRRER